MVITPMPFLIVRSSVVTGNLAVKQNVQVHRV